MDLREVSMDAKKGTVLSGIAPVLAQIQQGLPARPKEWLGALQQDPGKFADVEKEIHRAFAQMADTVVAVLLVEAAADCASAPTAKKNGVPADPQRNIRRRCSRKLRGPLPVGLRVWGVRWGGGVVGGARSGIVRERWVAGGDVWGLLAFLPRPVGGDVEGDAVGRDPSHAPNRVLVAGRLAHRSHDGESGDERNDHRCRLRGCGGSDLRNRAHRGDSRRD